MKPQFHKSLAAYTDAPVTCLAASPDGTKRDGVNVNRDATIKRLVQFPAP